MKYTDQETIILKHFWENCDTTFAHVTIDKYLKNQDSLFNFWQKNFLDDLKDYYDLQDKILIDYGIGGGYFGLYATHKFNVKKYIGIDIAERQINEAKNILTNNNVNHELFLIPVNFKSFNANIFVSQATIQHFPSIDYLNNFLMDINESGIKFVILQIRHSNTTTVRTGSYQTTEEVRLKLHTNKEYISNFLSQYNNVFHSKVLTNQYQYLFYDQKH